jgi:hypothetical protein
MQGVLKALTAVSVLVLAFTAAAPAKSSRPAAADLSSPDAVLRWINTYRQKPDPANVPTAVKALSSSGALTDPEKAGVYVGFLAGALLANPAQADAMIAKILPLPEEDEWVVVRAIAWSGHPQWQHLLARAKPKLVARRAMIDKYLTGQLPTLDQLVIERGPTFRQRMRGYFNVSSYFKPKGAKLVKLDPSPDVLDTLWGYWFATRSDVPLSRIIALLVLSKEKDSADKLVVGSMAKYTLASNASRDSSLLATLRGARPQQDPDTGAVLTEVVEAAETVDIVRIRKEALAAIEDLKRKGPGSQREVAWWGKIGQGAIAVGCVGAAVAGAAAVGIPCVVGGAASSAALNMWGTQ